MLIIDNLFQFKEYMAYQYRASNRQIPNISQIKSLKQLIDNYPNEEIIPQFRQVMKHYPNFRAIRGDGNCFYRAIAFLYLSNAPLQQFQKCFQDIRLACQHLPIDFQEEKDWKDQLFVMWQNYLLPIAQTKNRQQQLVKIFNSFIVFDILMVAYFRSLNYQYLKNNQAKFEPYTEKGIFEQLERITTFNQESQGIQLTTMAQALSIKITVAYADKNIFKNILYNQRGRDQEYYLFFRPGHYDIVYPKNEKNLKIQPWSSAIRNWNCIGQNKGRMHSKFAGKNQTYEIKLNSTKEDNYEKKFKPLNNFLSSYDSGAKIQTPTESFKQNKFVFHNSQNQRSNLNHRQEKIIDPRITNGSKSFQSKISTTAKKNDTDQQDFKYMMQNSKNTTSQSKNNNSTIFRSSSTSRPSTQYFKVKGKKDESFSLGRLSMQLSVLGLIVLLLYTFLIR